MRVIPYAYNCIDQISKEFWLLKVFRLAHWTVPPSYAFIVAQFLSFFNRQFVKSSQEKIVQNAEIVEYEQNSLDNGFCL